ncbi:MAG: aldehyde dehydrogenase family protein [Hyphomonadaceae bacterium]|nr:MAG: aldehyde dehydrogenase (NAD+) [Caulobacteraceae bacterium]MBT9446127.1 aldehyde dehydrogenase family protein [Hyphomonadaceae bacterium]TPW04152.1 MAG: aldehyde dehydrogenase (NAD+) [Alphaproteobacteria bacterium]
MREHLNFYIDGQWVAPATPRTHEVINPANEEPIAKISLGGAADVDKAVAAAQRAFETFQFTSREERMALLGAIIGVYQKRMNDVAEAISSEMGAPLWLAKAAQAPAGLGHFANTLEVLKNYKFEDVRGSTLLRYEPVGVCGFITPWNWPINQIACKVAPALAAGCTMVLKPSELSPLNAIIFAEILHEAGVPKGVFNLVNGDGPGVGEALSKHPGVDMMSFTGSTRAGIMVAKNAAETVKRVAQELGGKSANIILEDADLNSAVAGGMATMTVNSGQSCNAPSRMFVPRGKQDQAAAIAKGVAEGVTFGVDGDGRPMGPLSNANQFQKVQALIQKGIDEGATLVTGGVGRPPGVNRGYYVRPTVFANVTNDMTIAREEIFGPVLCILPYDTEEEAVRQANDTVYGLSGYVSGEPAHAKAVAAKLRTGNVHLNGAGADFNAPFGGYKQSGNGREWGEFGFEDFLEVKAVMGAA